MPTTKKTSAKKPAKAVKKVAKKAAKSAKPKVKPAKKTSAKKPAKKVAQKDTVLSPVKFAGAAVVRPVDDPGEATEGEVMSVKPELDDSGVLIMVPQTK